jgi:hypothetical protein
MVCGIYWLPDAIAINIHQLRSLIPKCKSSINVSLQKLGFSNSPGRTASGQTITSIFPFLKDNLSALRKWTIREKTSEIIVRESDHPVPTQPFFEISLDGLAWPRDESVHEEEERSDDFGISIEGDGPWEMPKNDELGADLYGTIPDCSWINGSRGE